VNDLVPVSEADAPRGADAWPVDERPGFLIRRLHQIHVSLFAEMCAGHGLTPLQFSLMSSLIDLGRADQTRLAGAIAVDRTTTTGVLKRLETRGLVTRVTSADDRRSRACSLTAQGRALHAAIEASARRAHDTTLMHLTPNEQAVLIGLMKRVIAGHSGRTDGSALL